MTDAASKPSVLFVCVKNGGKSQMAAGLMSRRHLQVYSAGTKQGSAVNTLSAQALAEVGVDITGQTPTLTDQHSFVTLTSWSRSDAKPMSTLFLEPSSRSGTPTSPRSAATMAWITENA